MANHLGRQGRLGRQKLTRENLGGQSVFMPKRITGIIKSGGNMTQELTESIDFLPNGTFLCSWKSCFSPFYCLFF
jgi:hypothetical protein